MRLHTRKRHQAPRSTPCPTTGHIDSSKVDIYNAVEPPFSTASADSIQTEKPHFQALVPSFLGQDQHVLEDERI